MTEDKPSKGRVRRWLDKRRESQRRAADIAQRSKQMRKADEDSARRHGSGTDAGGPFVGGF